MFEFCLRGLRVRFCFGFFATVTLLMLINGDSYAVMGLAACLWHELGHFAAMRLCGVPVNRLVFYGGGIMMIPDKRIDFTGFWASLVIYLAGSAANFALAAFLPLFGTPVLTVFSSVNIVIGAFNLLPLGYLDGGKIILLVIRRVCSFSCACLLERYLKWLDVFLVMAVLILFTAVMRVNFTLYLTLCYLLISVLSCPQEMKGS